MEVDFGWGVCWAVVGWWWGDGGVMVGWWVVGVCKPNFVSNPTKLRLCYV